MPISLFAATKVSENITLIMKKRNISFSEVSRRLGVERSTLWRWKNGKRKIDVDAAITLAYLAHKEELPPQ